MQPGLLSSLLDWCFLNFPDQKSPLESLLNVQMIRQRSLRVVQKSLFLFFWLPVVQLVLGFKSPSQGLIQVLGSENVES